MICPKCGVQLNDGVAFCPKCGNKIENNITNNATNYVSNQPIPNNAVFNTVATENVQKKPKTWKVVLITVAVTIVAGFVGLLVIGSRATNTSTQNAATSGEVREIQPEGAGSNTPATSDAGALNELLGYIDQAEELVSKMQSDIQTIDDEEINPKDIYRQKADVVGNLISDLSDLQKQVDAVSGVNDTNLENATKEYFNMIYDAQKAHFEIYDFFADYFIFLDIIEIRPQEENYTSFAEYYTDLATWYETLMEGYSSIESCPSCLESEWEQYGDILDLNYYVLDKLYLAVQYVDELRYQSALNISDRYVALEEKQYSEFLNCLKGEVQFFQNQKGVASKLAEEIHAYAELNEGERSGYEFEYIRTGKITLNYDAVDTIYPSLYNTYDAFVIVKTGCLSGNRKILVEAEIPGFTQSYKESFTLDSAYRAISIKPPLLTGDLDLTSTKDAQINVTISETDGTLIEAKSFPITIQSKYDFDLHSDEYGVATQDSFLCFLTPESSAISQLKRQAINEISNMTNGKIESFVGYQDNPYNDVYVGTYLQTAGIMRAMNTMGVRYLADSFSISNGHQHVLFPEDVLEEQHGLCVETALVVASALQSAGMHAFLVFPPGHAQVAVEIWNGNDGNMEGVGEYFLIETTMVDDDSNNQSVYVTYANAMLNNGIKDSTYPIAYLDQEGWYNYITNQNVYIIDCDDSSVLGLTVFSN